MRRKPAPRSVTRSKYKSTTETPASVLQDWSDPASIPALHPFRKQQHYTNEHPKSALERCRKGQINVHCMNSYCPFFFFFSPFFFKCRGNCCLEGPKLSFWWSRSHLERVHFLTILWSFRESPFFDGPSHFEIVHFVKQTYDYTVNEEVHLDPSQHKF